MTTTRDDVIAALDGYRNVEVASAVQANTQQLQADLDAATGRATAAETDLGVALKALAAKPAQPAPASRAGVPAGGLFRGPTSIFRTRVDKPGTTLAQAGVKGAANWRPSTADSQTIVDELVRQVAGPDNRIAAFNVWRYGLSYWTATDTDPRVALRFARAGWRWPTPAWWADTMTGLALPAAAIPTVGTDASLSVYDPVTRTLWDAWKFGPDPANPGGYVAAWGGKIADVSASPGYYPNGTGTAATGIAEGGSVSIADVLSGAIDHALTIAVPNPAPSSTLSWPAQRGDGDAASISPLLQGQRLRLSPAVNVDALQLHPIARMIARAAQRYGFVVADRTTGWVGIGVENPGSATIGDPNPWTIAMGNTPHYAIMKGFPWVGLQALPRDYGLAA